MLVKKPKCFVSFKKIKIILVLFGLLYSVPTLAAYSLGDAFNPKDAKKSFVDRAANKAGVDQKEVSDIVGVGIKGALQLVGIFFFIMMVYGGFVWMTARGNEERVGKARKIVIGAVIGVAVVVSAYAITNFIGRVAPKYGPGTTTPGAVCNELSGLGQSCATDEDCRTVAGVQNVMCNSNNLCQGTTGLCENVFGACGAYSCNNESNCQVDSVKRFYCPSGNETVCCIPR